MAQTRKYYLKNNSFDLEVKGKGPTKVITVCDTPPYEDAPTYQISLTSQKKQLFDLEVKGQRSQRYATVPYGHAPTNQISLTYLERQKCYGPDKKILFKKQLFAIQVKGQSPMKVITVCDTPPYGHAPTYQI